VKWLYSSADIAVQKSSFLYRLQPSSSATKEIYALK
jgi:hypothetical protein